MLDQNLCKTYQAYKSSHQPGTKLPYQPSQFATREHSGFSDSGLSQAWSIQSEKAHAQLEARLTVRFLLLESGIF